MLYEDIDEVYIPVVGGEKDKAVVYEGETERKWV